MFRLCLLGSTPSRWKSFGLNSLHRAFKLRIWYFIVGNLEFKCSLILHPSDTKRDTEQRASLTRAEVVHCAHGSLLKTDVVRKTWYALNMIAQPSSALRNLGTAECGVPVLSDPIKEREWPWPSTSVVRTCACVCLCLCVYFFFPFHSPLVLFTLGLMIWQSAFGEPAKQLHFQPGTFPGYLFRFLSRSSLIVSNSETQKWLVERTVRNNGKAPWKREGCHNIMISMNYHHCSARTIRISKQINN